MYKKNFIVIAVVMVLLASFTMTGCGRKSKEISLNQESTFVGEEATEQAGDIYVHVVGEVKSPGVVQVPNGTRLYNVIEKAGGMTDDAKKDYLNLAETVKDGQKIKVYSNSEYKRLKKKESKETPKESGSASSAQAGLININTATVSELTQLSGIGESKANAIVEYRTQNGNFKTIEDIKNVSGIGDATFNNIKTMITVN